MKKIIFLSFAILTFCNCYSQFLLINDPDGYTNLRKSESVNSEILCRIYDYDLFWNFDGTNYGSWESVYYYWPIDSILKYDPTLKINKSFLNDNRLGKKGYIHKSRIQKLSDFSINFESSIAENDVHLWNNSMDLKIKKSVFNETDYKIERHEEGWVKKINNKRPWGTDGNMPGSKIEDIILTIDSSEIVIPKESYADLFEPNFNAVKIYKKDSVWYISMSNSDGAGWYSIIWLIKHGKYWKRHLFEI